MHTAINLRKYAQVSVGILLLLITACSSDKKKAIPVTLQSPVAVVVAIPSGAGQDGINISGQIESLQTVNISTRVIGFITMLKVKVGDRVSKGQLLVTINNQDILAKQSQTDAIINEAQAAVKNAQKDLDRFTILYKQQSATAKELENATLQYTTAKARLEGANQMRNEVSASVGYTQLRSPLTGIVTQKFSEAGSMASPGMPILTIEQTGSYQVSASVPENSIHQIQPGVATIIQIKSLNRTISGKITQINPSSQFTGSQYIIKVSIPGKDNSGLYSGMYATVQIPTTGHDSSSKINSSVMVPVSSIERKDQLTGLYTIGHNNTALLRWVRLGKTYNEKVEVLAGLEKNEQFIVSADGKLFNGVPVKIN